MNEKQILSDAARGILPEGAYLIRSVEYDGVQTVTTDSGARRETAGDHAREPHFALVTNIPRQGPAWPRLVVDRRAYGIAGFSIPKEWCSR